MSTYVRDEQAVESCLKLSKRDLAERLVDVMTELDEASDYFKQINLAANEAEGIVRSPAALGLLDEIQRRSLGGWADAIGCLEVGHPLTSDKKKEEK